MSKRPRHRDRTISAVNLSSKRVVWEFPKYYASPPGAFDEIDKFTEFDRGFLPDLATPLPCIRELTLEQLNQTLVEREYLAGVREEFEGSYNFGLDAYSFLHRWIQMYEENRRPRASWTLVAKMLIRAGVKPSHTPDQSSLDDALSSLLNDIIGNSIAVEQLDARLKEISDWLVSAQNPRQGIYGCSAKHPLNHVAVSVAIESFDKTNELCRSLEHS